MNVCLKETSYNKSFWWIYPTPFISYSLWVNHILLNELSEANIQPPFQAELSRSGGANNRIFVFEGASTFNSCNKRFPKSIVYSLIHSLLLVIVVPPERRILLYNSFLKSISQPAIVFCRSFEQLNESFPTNWGLNKTSPICHLSLPIYSFTTIPYYLTCITFPSGNW